MKPKRCFHFTACSLEPRCELAHADIKHGQFQSERTGEHCHHFKPLSADINEYERIAARMGALK